MSSAPSICTNYPIKDLTSLATKLNSINSITNQLSNYTGSEYATNINAFNFLVGFQYETSSFFYNGTAPSELNNKFNASFMYNAWSIKSNIQALSELILSLEGNNGTVAINQTDLYNFWNSYFDFVFYQFFCLQTGLTTNNFINLTQPMPIQINNLYLLMLESSGGGFGSGGTGTKRMCQFCATFWSSSSSSSSSSGGGIRENIVNYPSLNKFCGCCSGIPLINLGDNGPTQPPLRCQPICSDPTVVKNYAGSDSLVNNGGDLTYQDKGSDFYSDAQSGFFMPYSCPNQTICIMDKLNIQVAGFNNQLDFNQVCPGCTNGECECFIDSGSNVIQNMGANGIGMNDPETFNQKCGKGAYCFNLQGDGTRTQVLCNSNNAANTSKNQDINYNGSGQPNYLNSITTTNNYAYGINNIILPLAFLAVIVFYLLLTAIDTVSHIRRTYKMKQL